MQSTQNKIHNQVRKQIKDDNFNPIKKQVKQEVFNQVMNLVYNSIWDHVNEELVIQLKKEINAINN